MNSAGVTPANLAQKWQFEVQVAGFKAALFSKSDLPEMEFDEVTFAPGGSMFDQKVAGRAKFNDITLEKGVPQDNVELDIMAWIRQCITVNAAGGAGSIGGFPIADAAAGGYLRDVDIVVYDRHGAKVRTFTLYGAWVKSYKPGDLEGGSSDNIIESMTLTYQYYDVQKHK